METQVNEIPPFDDVPFIFGADDDISSGPYVEPMPFGLVYISDVTEIPEQAWLIPGMIPAGGLVEMHGAPGSGKTFVAVQIAATVSQSHSVVEIAAEGSATVKRRIKAWEVHNHTSVGKLAVSKEPVNLLDFKEVDKLIRHFVNKKPDLVIFDTLACCMVGGDENSSKDMGMLVGACKTIQASLDAAVLLIHHTTKSNDTERGHSALRGACDSMMLVTNSTDVISVTSSKLRDGEPFNRLQYRLQTDSTGSVLVPITPSAQPRRGVSLSPDSLKIAQVLLGKADGVRRTEIESLDGLTKGAVQRELTSLKTAGYIEQFPNKRYHLTPSGEAMANLCQTA